MAFSEERVEQFNEDLSNLRPIKVRIERRMEKILKAPYQRSEALGKGRWEDLTGKRSAKIEGGGVVLILAICEACIKNGWQKYNLPICGDICQNKPLQRVVWMIAGRHDSAYGKK